MADLKARGLMERPLGSFRADALAHGGLAGDATIRELDNGGLAGSSWADFALDFAEIMKCLLGTCL